MPESREWLEMEQDLPAPPTCPAAHRRPAPSRLAVRGAAVAVALGLSAGASVAAPGPATASAGGAPSTSPPQRFDVMEYRIEGNTLLSVLEVEEAVYPFLGPGRTADDVEAARAALETAYSRKGYPTVTAEVPQQEVSAQVVVLRVVERPVGRLRVRGSRYFSLTAIKEAAPSLKEGAVPKFDAVEQDIIDLNLQPDRRVTPVLKAGITPGTVDVDLMVEDQFPLHGSLELNNRKSRDTEPLRLLASLRYDNLWQRGDSISLSYQTAPQRTTDTEVFSGSYLARVPESRLSLLVYGLRSNSDVASVGDLNVIGDGEVIGGRAVLPLTIASGFVQSLTGGVDYKHFGEDVVLGSDRTSAPITYYPFSLGYVANWIGEQSRSELGSTVVFTFAGLGSNSRAFDSKRFDADPSFILLQLEGSRTQELPGGVQLYGRAAGQAAGQPLISNEQFSIGGLDSVRGYLESEALGDYGVALQAELRSPSLSRVLAPYLAELRVHGFADYGAAGIHRPLPEQDGSFILSSAGIGVRAKVLDRLNGGLDVAVPLKNGPDTEEGHVRTLFRAWGEF